MSLFNLRTADLDRLNSMTKYPSILTYHSLGEKGALIDTIQVPFTGRIVGTEKVDGTNSRIIVCPDGTAIVGSREDLLWASTDVIHNPAMGIVDAMRDLTRRILPHLSSIDAITVLYLETFGKGIGNGAKNYTKTGNVAYRLFDVMQITNYDQIMSMPKDQIARWREDAGQPFLNVDALYNFAQAHRISRVPSLFDCDADTLPTTIEGVHKFLRETQPTTGCKLDPDALGVPEGIVVRTPSRSAIAKLRREDYDRTVSRKRFAIKG